MGCNFCTTSAFFGGKGKILNFYSTGEELFRRHGGWKRTLGVQSFFMMDENFLLTSGKARHGTAGAHEGGRQELGAVRLLVGQRHPQVHHAELVELGVSWVWMGLESPHSGVRQAEAAPTRMKLTRELREHGIKLLGSTIVGLEHHTPENIEAEIEHAIAHDTDFHQFMLYTPVPGTPLYRRDDRAGRMLEDVDLADIHGQDKFNFKHAAISREDSKKWLDWAFRRDFERNGPSIYRICRTTLEGWMRYKNDPDARVRGWPKNPRRVSRFG
jgi:hypothetical protein